MYKNILKGSKSGNNFIENYGTLYDIKYIKIKYFLEKKLKKGLYEKMR